MDSSITTLTNATRMLAEVRNIDDAKKIINLAEAARVYAKQVELGLEAQNHAAEIKLRAQRKAGEILSTMEKAQGKRTDLLTSSQPVTKYNDTPTLEELGIARNDSSRWQQIAAMPEQAFEEFIDDAKAEGRELTTAAVYREAKFETAKQGKVEPPDIKGRYRIFYADPPWRYNDKLVDGYGPAEYHYPTMTIDELCNLPVKNMTEDNAVLFLWVTSPLLEESFKIIHAWGFEYKTSFIWDKVKHNMGHYNSVRHELLLVCTKGSCTPDIMKLHDSVYSEERTEHSVKPEHFRSIIDEIYPTGKRIELFARRPANGWEVWGNE